MRRSVPTAASLSRPALSHVVSKYAQVWLNMLRAAGAPQRGLCGVPPPNTYPPRRHHWLPWPNSPGWEKAGRE